MAQIAPETSESERRASALGRRGVAVGLTSAVISALLVRFSFPPFDWAPLALIGWVPLLLLVGRQRPSALFGWAYLQSLVLNLTVHWWIVPGVRQAVGLSVWGAGGVLGSVAVVQALRTPLVLLVVHSARRRRFPVWASFPVASAIAETQFPLLFPWTMALQVHGVGPWLQLASLAGASGVTLWVALINALLARAWEMRARATRALGLLSAAGAVLGSVTICGLWVSKLEKARERAAPLGRIALGHLCTPPDSTERDWVPAMRAATTAAIGAAPHPDVVLWPETVVARPIEPDRLPKLARDYLLRDRALGTRAPTIDAPLLLGAILSEKGNLYNSAVLLDRGGRVASRYDKRRLVPLGESSRLASWLPGLEDWFPAATQFTPGDEGRRFRVGQHPVALSICYEDILPDDFRSAVLDASPELLVNLTSDAWFAGTDAADFHLALAKLRSVEHRKYLVRSTRDGVSVVIDSIGQVVASLDRSRTDVGVVNVRWLSGKTLYTRDGDKVLWTVFGLWSALGAFATWRAGRCDKMP